MTRRRTISTLAFTAFALAACGEKQQPAVAAVEAPADPQVTLAGGLTPAVTAPAVARLTSFAEAESAYRAGRIDEAREFFAGYVATTPENPWGYYMLGLALWKQGDFGGADQALNRSLELDATNSKAYFNSGRVLLSLGRDHEAFERIEEGLLLDSTSTDGLRLLARAHARLDNVDGALEIYRRALVLDENDVWTLNNLGMLYLETGNAESALGPLARAVTLRGTSPIFQNNLGAALERAGHPVSARRAYEAAAKADSSYQKARRNLERVSQIVADATASDGIKIVDLAETFRLQIGMWKDRYPRPAADSGAVKDSLPPATR